MPKEMKVIYLLLALVTFTAGLILAMIFFKGDMEDLASNYLLLLGFYIAIMIFIYAVMKLFFHDKPKNERSLLELDNDDIRRGR